MEGFCRGCLRKFSDPTDLIQYCEKNRRLFVYSTGLQVKRNDSLTFQLCKECYLNMKQSCKFKKQCRSSDRMFRSYLSSKECEETIDFSTYIKNAEDRISLKLSTASINSTPAYQRNKDDDNESTCTSIRNFMTDILQGEEMPPSEAQIIHEVIQEEADILDDSLDSHWLNDDVDSVFGMDFNYSSFSTPFHSINGDHCYTPRKLKDDKEREVNYYTLKEIQKANNANVPAPNDMPILDDIDLENADSRDVNSFLSKHCKELIKESNKQFARQRGYVSSDTANSDTSPLHQKNHNDDLPQQKEMLLFEENYGKRSIENGYESNIDKDHNKFPHKIIEDFSETTLNTELESYINKVECKSRGNKLTTDNKHDAIDRNLEKALKNETAKEFSLEKILQSPQDSLRSGVSTPTIRNILFGGMTPKIEDAPNITQLGEIQEIHNNDIERLLHMHPKKHVKPGKDISVLKKFLKEKSDIDYTDLKNDVTSKMDISNDDDDSNVDSISEENEDTQDLDISVSKLLDTGDTEVDLNISVASDFLKESLKDDASQNEEDPFKRPFSPLDHKMDLVNKECKICYKHFSSVRALKVHFTKAHKSTKQKSIRICEFCGKTFNDASNMQKHIRSHQEYLEKFKCEICQLTMPSEHGLKLHKKIHTTDSTVSEKDSEKLYECDICHLKLSTYSYNQHIRTHFNKSMESDETFECDKCQLDFKSKKALMSHMRMHEGYKGPKKIEKAYVCEICGKTTRGLGNHNVHMNRHEKKYLINCDVCNLGFYRMFDYNTHMSSHTLIFPFKCKHCPRTFKHRRQLREHMIMKHKVTKYEFQCDLCNTKYKFKSVLKRHLKYCMRSKKI